MDILIINMYLAQSTDFGILLSYLIMYSVFEPVSPSAFDWPQPMGARSLEQARGHLIERKRNAWLPLNK